MPGFANCLWWVVLGGFAGWCLYWFIDVMFRRDGEAAGVRERREISAKSAQLSDLQEERDRLSGQLEDSQSGTQRLSGLLESLRDTVAEQEQKITNLEVALAAARESQRPGTEPFQPRGTDQPAASDGGHRLGQPVPAAGPGPDVGIGRAGSMLSRLAGKSADPDDRAERPSTSGLFDRLRSTLSRNQPDSKS